MSRLQIFLLSLFLFVLAVSAWLYGSDRAPAGVYIVIAAIGAALLSPILFWKRKEKPDHE